LGIELLATHGSNDGFHVVEILLESLAPRGGEAVFGLGNTAFEGLAAGDVIGLFQFAGVDAEITVTSVEEFFQLVEGEGSVSGKGADNTEAKTLVNQAVKM
jgi:hypothetical protein